MIAAARQLARTERGRTALGRLAALLADDDLPLSLLDQRAFLALLGGAWKGKGACVREAIEVGSREARQEEPRPPDAPSARAGEASGASAPDGRPARRNSRFRSG